MKRIALAIALAVPFLMAAGPGDKLVVTIPMLDSGGSAWSAENMTGPAQTSPFTVEGLDYVQFYLSAASVTGTADVTIDCYVGQSATDVNYHVQSESITAGVATQYDYVPTHSVTTADKWISVVPTHRAKYMYCTFTCASGTLGLVTVGGNY